MNMPDFPRQPSLISMTKFCEEAGLSPEALDKALLSNQIFTVQLHGEASLPDSFLHERYDRRQLATVSKLLADLSGESKLQFFTTPKGSLGGQTPLEALADRKFAAVRRTAQGFAER